MTPPQLAGIQLDIAWEDKPRNHRRAAALLAAAALPAGSLIALPEMFSTGFSMNVSGIEEGAARETERFLSQVARETGSFVAGGVVTAAPDGRGRNEAVLFGPDGSERLRYQKIHPFSYAGETEHYQPGGSIQSFEWNGFRTAIFICYDLRFPEIFRHAAHGGVQLFVVIANWPQPREDHWVTLLRARAIENQAYVLGVNRSGIDPAAAYSGRSLIVDPRGAVIADAGSAVGVVAATPSLEALLEYRARFPSLADMRPEFLGLPTE